MRIWVTILMLAFSTSAFSDERILSFHSDVRVFTDGVIEVTETIQVRAEGNQIRRGIYRDIPVEYRDRLGNKYEISIEPLSVLRNDMPESFHTVRSRRDIRTYFGRSNYLIEPGVHTYRYRYRANRMLGFFEQHDELYWNVTGNRWAFPIDNEAGVVHFSGNKPLPAAHGLTIVVGWPKGMVVEPTQVQRIGWLLSDNRNLLVAIIGFVLTLAYYIPVWRKHGKDPEEGVIVTRYKPPPNFSPASLRYIRQMYYDDKTMTAAIVSLAVKGYLQIKKKGGTHSIIKKGSGSIRAALAAGEQEIYIACSKMTTW